MSRPWWESSVHLSQWKLMSSHQPAWLVRQTGLCVTRRDAVVTVGDSWVPEKTRPGRGPHEVGGSMGGDK